jgi:hypothetical protein
MQGDEPMPDYTSKLLTKLVVIYEMDGMDSVEKYAKANNIPFDVCRKLIEDYVLTPPEGPKLDNRLGC